MKQAHRVTGFLEVGLISARRCWVWKLVPQQALVPDFLAKMSETETLFQPLIAGQWNIEVSNS